MLRLVLVRHGETSWNLEHRIQGAGSDVDLSQVGKKQAECTGDALKRYQLDAVYSSPLLRAHETAAAIARHHGLTVALEPDLKEIDAGDFEGRTVESIGGALSQFMFTDKGGKMPVLPGGEGLDELQARAWSAIERVVAGRQSGAIVVVSHYFTILTVICRALDFPLTTLRRLRTNPASISMIGFVESRRTLLSLNDICHLSPLA